MTIDHNCKEKTGVNGRTSKNRENHRDRTHNTKSGTKRRKRRKVRGEKTSRGETRDVGEGEGDRSGAEKEPLKEEERAVNG